MRGRPFQRVSGVVATAVRVPWLAYGLVTLGTLRSVGEPNLAFLAAIYVFFGYVLVWMPASDLVEAFMRSEAAPAE
jgi:hypothetical protein